MKVTDLKSYLLIIAVVSFSLLVSGSVGLAVEETQTPSEDVSAGAIKVVESELGDFYEEKDSSKLLSLAKNLISDGVPPGTVVATVKSLKTGQLDTEVLEDALEEMRAYVVEDDLPPGQFIKSIKTDSQLPNEVEPPYGQGNEDTGEEDSFDDDSPEELVQFEEDLENSTDAKPGRSSTYEDKKEKENAPESANQEERSEGNKIKLEKTGPPEKEKINDSSPGNTENRTKTKESSEEMGRSDAEKGPGNKDEEPGSKEKPENKGKPAEDDSSEKKVVNGNGNDKGSNEGKSGKPEKNKDKGDKGPPDKSGQPDEDEEE